MTITIKEITPAELAQKIEASEKLFLLDVREPNEVANESYPIIFR